MEEKLPEDGEEPSLSHVTVQLTVHNAAIGLRVVHLGTTDGGPHGVGNLLGWKWDGVRVGDTGGGLQSDGYCRVYFDSKGHGQLPQPTPF